VIVPMMQKYSEKKPIDDILKRIKLKIDCSSSSSESEDDSSEQYQK
jgi:hypothetical protein